MPSKTECMAGIGIPSIDLSVEVSWCRFYWKWDSIHAELSGPSRARVISLKEVKYMTCVTRFEFPRTASMAASLTILESSAPERPTQIRLTVRDKLQSGI